MEQSNRRFWLLAGVSVFVLVLAYGPMLLDFFGKQWERPHYQYFPFVWGAFAWLVWQRCSQAVEKSQESSVESRGPDVGSGFAAQRSERNGEEEGQRAANRYDVVVALLAAWLLLGVAYFSNSPWLAYLSFICLVTSAFLQLSSKWEVPYLWGVWLLLWLVVPLPLNRDQQLISQLQAISSRLSSLVLDYVGVIHMMDGNSLILPEKQFFVDEACSGIVSVMSIIACAVIYGVWRNRPPLHLLVLAVAGVGWATLMNVVRISVIAIAYDWWRVDWSSGTSHEILGLVIFLFTFLALVSTDYVLLFVLSPVRASYVEQYGDLPGYGAWLAAAWDWLQTLGRPVAWAAAGVGEGVTTSEERGAIGNLRGSTYGVNLPDAVHERSSNSTGEEVKWPLASKFVLGVVPLLAFGLLAGTQLVLPIWFPNRTGEPPHNLERALALGEAALPKDFGDATLASFTPQTRSPDDVFGNYSRVYEYRDGRGNTYLVSCDFPLEPDGHELTLCYRGIGWQMMRRELAAEPETTLDHPEESWGFVEADFRRSDGNAAFLVFCSFDEYGARVTPRSGSIWGDIRRSLQKQVRSASPERTYQVQVWTIATGTVHEEQKSLARELLLNVRERFRIFVTVGEVGSEVEE